MKSSMRVLATFLAALLLSACGGNGGLTTPTLSLESVQTSAVETFSFSTTQTALFGASPTPTPTFAPVTSPTLALFTPASNGNPGAGNNPPCYNLSYVADVTIPDSTPMSPGQMFTKTWKVRNSGSCAWDVGFRFDTTGGDNMQGLPYFLTASVAPGLQIDISIDMVAPTNKTGLLRSNWRMFTKNNQVFGDEPYVLIAVGIASATTTGTGGAATNTPITFTPTSTGTATATVTPTATP